MHNHITWQQIPLVRFTCPILGGAILYIFMPQGIPSSLGIITLTVLLSSLLFFKRKYWSIPFLLFCVLFGFIHFQNKDQVYAQIPEVPLDTFTNNTLIVEKVKWDEGNKRWKGAFKLLTSQCKSPVHIYGWVEDSNLQFELDGGDTLLVVSSLQLPSPPKIPGSFDFRQFLQRKNTPFITYVSEGNVRKHLPVRKHALIEALYHWRERTKSLLSDQLSPLTASILRAILFGDSEKLSDETRAIFSEAGIAHILAVSGMHVGILIMIIIGVISPLKFHPKRKAWIQFVLIILCVWLYVAICDFAASASRAALMASLYYLGKALKIRASALNTLGCSALILFMIDPFYLLDLGTQLSFGAMAGILLSFPDIEQLLIRYTLIPPKICSLLAISFAAQAGVAPLILYYFGSFPLLFWLFSIPAAYFAVFLFIGGWLWVLVSGLVPFLQELLGDILNIITQLFVGSLSTDVWGSLPVWDVPYYPIILVVLSYLLTIQILFWIIRRDRKSLRSAMINCLLIAGIWHWHFQWQEQRLHIEAIRTEEYSSIIFFHDRIAHILTHDSIPNKEQLEMDLPNFYPLDSIEYLKVKDPNFDRFTAFFEKTGKIAER